MGFCNQSTGSTCLVSVSYGLLEGMKIVVSYHKQLSILHLLQIKLLKKYLTNNAENSISEPLGFTIFWGACPQPPLEVLAFGAGKTCLVCQESLSGWGLCGNGFDGGGGVVIVPYWILKIVRPSEKILPTPLIKRLGVLLLPLDGMLVHHRVPHSTLLGLTNGSLLLIYIPGSREIMGSKVSSDLPTPEKGKSGVTFKKTWRLWKT